MKKHVDTAEVIRFWPLNAKVQSVNKIIETMELCRLGVWEEHRPAIDSILRDLHRAGFEISKRTLNEI
jgi:predicted nucleic acid-binding protein